MSIINKITARLQSNPVNAVYEGTKSKDLMAYIKSLVPSIRFMPPDAAGGSRDPGVKDGNLTAQQAYDLGTKLIEDGWYGRKTVSKTKKPDGTIFERECVLYVPSSENGVEYTSEGMPNVRLFRPSEGSKFVRMRISQTTKASARERSYLLKLNKLANSRARPPAISKGYWGSVGRGRHA